VKISASLAEFERSTLAAFMIHRRPSNGIEFVASVSRALEAARAGAQLPLGADCRSPFYARFHRGRWKRPIEDLPIFTKSILMENFDELITDRSIRVKAHSAGVEQHYASLWATVPLNRRR
jgi:hypothetical protein